MLDLVVMLNEQGHTELEIYLALMQQTTLSRRMVLYDKVISESELLKIDADWQSLMANVKEPESKV